MRTGMRFTIKAVNNGIILTWHCQGLGPFKEPYKEYQGVYVFKTWDELSAHIKEASSS